MAPSLIDTQPTAPHQLFSPSQKVIDRKIFPDGIKTSGQHPPLYDQLRPYSDFPKEITGETFIEDKIPLTGISQDTFRLPKLSTLLKSVRHETLNGKGFILFKGFPVVKWGNQKSAVAYMGLGTYLGYFVSQNGRGHVLGHVKDLGEDSTQIDKVRIYRTNARQFFHADDSDIVGLLCIARALEGGESDIVSSHHVWNTLQKERPDVAETLTKPIWYFDRKGEVSVGEEPYIKTAIFYLETGENGRVYSKWDPYYVLEETCHRLRLHMILEIGDIQFLSNEHVLHARTAYTDHVPPAPRRHLMRLWLATPENEGGWKLPFHDSAEKKRGGIQVNDQAPVAPLDAE
ncbi:hypothetical protein DID88_007710 [Monilinia fructigena]|uniref:TauD/TfdA-like domain-containing protein n=1 Tax=Monilinia fructigena TaxID=38457 RepID=A0A395J459_9HELO|nr:hypothetical protein DID88_007710 [Monilinia fructigena]